MIKVRCSICDRPIPGQSLTEWPCFPFCSERCRLIDLGRWLGEGYRITAGFRDETETASDNESEVP